MITADQLLCHAVGDYVLQSHWMATEKTKRSIAAACHVVCYGIPFLFLRPSIAAMAVILGTHFVIDRWRLARFVAWTKNWLAPSSWHSPVLYDTHEGPWFDYEKSILRWSECRTTGYPAAVPAWLAVWLLIITDNIMHIIINGLALRYL